MSKILIVENNQSFVKLLNEVLPEFKETDDFVNCSSADELEAKAAAPGFWEDIALALVDLELGPDATEGPGDFLGRDTVLPLIRSVVPYVPTILVSRYVGGTRNSLAAATPFGFDAVLCKDFFSTPNTYVKQWKDLRHYATLNRNAAQTGRYVLELDELLKKPATLEYGAGLKETVESMGHDRVLDVLKLMDFGGSKIFFDEIVMGFSGLIVVKATVQQEVRRTSWLIKLGTGVHKLNEEIRAHRRMFLDGLTRHLTVPAFFWQPIFWNGLGAIAYEYEAEYEHFLDHARRLGATAAFSGLASALKQLYRESAGTVVIPRNVLTAQYSALRRLVPGKNYGAVVGAITGSSAKSLLDRSAQLLSGCQHGDFHGRNILATPSGMVFIDFAHYRSNRVGTPMLDLVKLVVDCWAFDVADWTAQNIADASVLDHAALADVLPIFLVSETAKITEAERSFFGAAAKCSLAIYTTYPDLLISKRTEANSVLAADH